MDADAAVVGRYVLTTGARDSTTGWLATTWTEDTDYEGATGEGYEALHRDSGVTIAHWPSGAVCLLDAIALTCDPFLEGDLYYHTPSQRYFSVEMIKQDWILNSFAWRQLHLRYLPMWESGPASATWKTSPDDPCSNIKDWIDVNARAAQIVKNDGSTQANWACVFDHPPYPVTREFRNPSSPVHGLYVLEFPRTTPILDSDQKPCRYKEVMPIHVVTIDSTGVTARALWWTMQRELRYIAENYETGSQLAHVSAPVRDESHELGSMRLMDIVYELSYVRDLTT